MIDDVQWFVGIDWATQSHRVCLLDVEGRHVNERDFAHGGAGLTEMRDWLLEKTKAAPGQIAVAIETPHGPVVEMLLDHELVSSPSIPSSSTDSAIASPSPAPRMTAATPVCSAVHCAPIARPSAALWSMIR